MHGIYQVRNAAGEVMYIGSTSLPLHRLESNHRNWKARKYSGTKFRKALDKYGEEWYFVWAIEPSNVSKQFIEIQEQALIQFVKPMYNIDMTPYESSIRYGRYERNTL